MERVYSLVSVIIPVYNRSGLISETLDSLIRQTYPNWEAIVIDDGSTDGTFQLVENMAESEKRIRLYKRDREPKGAPVCRNIGIEKSKGEYVIFLDSDDLMREFCIERRIYFFEKYHEEDFIVFQSVLFEKEIGDKNVFWNVDSEENDLQRFLRTDALWPICGPVYKREALIKVGYFRTELPFYQDFDLHLRILLLKPQYRKFLQLEPDCFIRHHFNNSVSNSIPFTNDLKILQQRIDFYFNQLEFIKQRKIKLNTAQIETIWGTLYYFCNRFLIEHNNLNLYYANWRKAGKLLPVNRFKHYITCMVPVLTSWQKRSKYFIKIKTWYLSVFKKSIADENVIFNSSMYKISTNQPHGI
ncbi:MAG: glycosyltransferase family 2 protein [Ginsengibacter sp.]